jgi:hypothetical protein
VCSFVRLGRLFHKAEKQVKRCQSRLRNPLWIGRICSALWEDDQACRWRLACRCQ